MTSMPLPSDHPMMKAWDEFCATDEFKNALRWSVETKYDDGRPVPDIQREQHAKGAMWLAFTKGLEKIGDLEAKLKASEERERQLKELLERIEMAAREGYLLRLVTAIPKEG